MATGITLPLLNENDYSLQRVIFSGIQLLSIIWSSSDLNQEIWLSVVKDFGRKIVPSVGVILTQWFASSSYYFLNCLIFTPLKVSRRTRSMRFWQPRQVIFDRRPTVFLEVRKKKNNTFSQISKMLTWCRWRQFRRFGQKISAQISKQVSLKVQKFSSQSMKQNL